MCGIIGIFNRSPGSSPGLRVDDLSPLRHRGPDGQGLHHGSQIALGHTRLSIIDLSSAAAQPMYSQDKRHVLVFNGEIYNYLELREELRTMGQTFSTSSDTEVILAAYRVWGTSCVSRFRGMFALALWDAQDRSLFLARDRCGERPLVFCRTPYALYFASEFKALLPLLPHRPALNPAVADMYLHYQYVPEPFTLLEGVRKLPPAHTLVLSADDWDAEPVRYWNVEDTTALPDVPTDTPGILASVRDALEDAVTLTLRADVPVAVALSGGIDSGAIAALAQKHYPEPMHAFCVGYPDRPHYDEREQARELAEHLGMIVHEVELPTDSFVDFFPELTRIMDEPIADPAAFGHFSVPKAAHDMGIKVLLTGIGGDELFWGYSWVTRTVGLNQIAQALRPGSLQRRFLGRAPVLKTLDRLARSSRVPEGIRGFCASCRDLGRMRTHPDQPNFYEAAPDFCEAFGLKAGVCADALRELPLDNPFRATAIGRRKPQDIPAGIVRLIFDTWLASNCLSLGDRVSMGVSVEARLPFLDVKLIETVMALRRTVPDHSLGQKAWLRASLKGVLPDKVLTRPKAGFQPPVWEWLSGVVKRYGHVLNNGALVQAGILDPHAAKRIPDEFLTQGWPGLFFAYKLVLLEMWHRLLVQEQA